MGMMMWEVKTREVKSVERKHGKKQVDKVMFRNKGHCEFGTEKKQDEHLLNLGRIRFCNTCWPMKSKETYRNLSFAMVFTCAFFESGPGIEFLLNPLLYIC